MESNQNMGGDKNSETMRSTLDLSCTNDEYSDKKIGNTGTLTRDRSQTIREPKDTLSQRPSTLEPKSEVAPALPKDAPIGNLDSARVEKIDPKENKQIA